MKTGGDQELRNKATDQKQPPWSGFAQLGSSTRTRGCTRAGNIFVLPVSGQQFLDPTPEWFFHAVYRLQSIHGQARVVGNQAGQTVKLVCLLGGLIREAQTHPARESASAGWHMQLSYPPAAIGTRSPIAAPTKVGSCGLNTDRDVHVLVLNPVTERQNDVVARTVQDATCGRSPFPCCGIRPTEGCVDTVPWRVMEKTGPLELGEIQGKAVLHGGLLRMLPPTSATESAHNVLPDFPK